MRGTATGVRDGAFELEPLPNWPEAFSPQHITVPSRSKAQLCPYPSVTIVAVEMPVTSTGVGEFWGSPFPSWPEKLFPQHFTVPPELTAQVWLAPVAT